MAADPFSVEQMRTVVTVAEESSFSRAAIRLGVTQPAVSSSVKGVEAALGRELFSRTSRGITLTSDGEAYLVYARAMIKVGEDARRHFREPSIAGVIRLGLNEDFARTIFPGALAIFCTQHPNYAFEVDCNLSTPLFAGLDEGRYAAVIAKRPAKRSGGERLWSEKMRWFGRPDTHCPVTDPVSLVLMPAPSETRDSVLSALQQNHRSWRVIFQSSSMSTLEAAVMAGVGVTAFGLHLHGPGLTMMDAACGLPELPEVDIVMERAMPDRNARGHEAEVDTFCHLMREMAVLSAGADHQHSLDEREET